MEENRGPLASKLPTTRRVGEAALDHSAGSSIQPAEPHAIQRDQQNCQLHSARTAST